MLCVLIIITVDDYYFQKLSPLHHIQIGQNPCVAGVPRVPVCAGEPEAAEAASTLGVSWDIYHVQKCVYIYICTQIYKGDKIT